MTNLFRSRIPEPAKPTPLPDEEQIAALARRRAAEETRQRRGRAATRLTEAGAGQRGAEYSRTLLG